MSMERATQDGYITHRSKHEKIIMHQPSWSYAWSITQPTWRWSYQHGKSYTRWLHHTPINIRKDYHATTFLIIRIKHNPDMFGVGVINMERDTRNGYITHRSIHEKIIMHQPSWSYASGITQPSWRWSYQHGKSYTRWLHHTPINSPKILACINLHDHTHQA